MQKIGDIKHRIKGISETRQITSAMEMISIAKMRKSLTKFETNQMYFESIRATIKDIVLHTHNVTHRYLTKRSGNRAVYIVIASDKGLAGGYNHNVLNLAWQSMEKNNEKFIFTVGQVAREYFENKKINIDGEFTHLTKDPSIFDANNIVDSIINLYDQNLMDEVFIVFTSMKSASVAQPAVIRLLPLVQEDVIGQVVDEDFKTDDYFKELSYDPSPDDVLDQLVPQYLIGVIYGALVQAVASEHSARRQAMTNATKNANNIIERLNIQFNRARQEAVTNELIEIMTAASSVKH